MDLPAPRRVPSLLMYFWKALEGKQIIVRLRGLLVMGIPVYLMLWLLVYPRVVSSRIKW